MKEKRRKRQAYCSFSLLTPRDFFGEGSVFARLLSRREKEKKGKRILLCSVNSARFFGEVNAFTSILSRSRNASGGGKLLYCSFSLLTPRDFFGEGSVFARLLSRREKEKKGKRILLCAIDSVRFLAK